MSTRCTGESLRRDKPRRSQFDGERRNRVIDKVRHETMNFQRKHGTVWTRETRRSRVGVPSERPSFLHAPLAHGEHWRTIFEDVGSNVLLQLGHVLGQGLGGDNFASSGGKGNRTLSSSRTKPRAIARRNEIVAGARIYKPRCDFGCRSRCNPPDSGFGCASEFIGSGKIALHIMHLSKERKARRRRKDKHLTRPTALQGMGLRSVDLEV